MRRDKLALGLVGVASGVVLALVACDTITLPPELTAPINQCSDTPSCQAIFPEAGASTCTSGVCVASSGFWPVLVVSTPSNAPVEPGMSVGLPGKPLPSGTKGPACQASGCIFLPSLQTTVGQVNVTGGTLGLGPLLVPGGLQPNVPATQQLSGTETTLPVSATFRPLWVDPASGSLMLASRLGLPLGEIHTTSEPNLAASPPEPTNASQPSKFGQLFSIGLVGGFTQTDTALGNYLLELVPEEPYSMFPPYVASESQPWLAGERKTVEYTLPSQGQIEATTYDVQTNAGAPSLAGWMAYAVDSHGFRITGKVALTGTPNEQFTLYDATQTTDQSGQQLYVVPPAGVPLPIYVDKAIGSVLARQISYPPLPSTETVSGPVKLDTDLTRVVTARMVFIADGASDGAAVLTTDLSTPYSQQLYYRADTVTDATGLYHVTLPPGKYRVYVIPDDADLALTVQMLVVTTDPNQQGKTVSVQTRAHVRGSVVLGDGTRVYGAQVIVDPSADAPLAPSGFDPLALPRESIGSTDANGQFDVLVDPGIVDISVRPRDGTRYPWVVTTNWKVLTDTTLPKSVVIPPPGDPSTTRSGGQLTDSLGNPLTRTIVRAYGFPPAAAPADGGTPSSRGARLVGMTTSDDTGLFELYAVPPDP